MQDAESGNTYYLNPTTGETKWSLSPRETGIVKTGKRDRDDGAAVATA